MFVQRTSYVYQVKTVPRGLYKQLLPTFLHSFLPSPLHIISHRLQAHPSSPHTPDTFDPKLFKLHQLLLVFTPISYYLQFHLGPLYTLYSLCIDFDYAS